MNPLSPFLIVCFPQTCGITMVSPGRSLLLLPPSPTFILIPHSALSICVCGCHVRCSELSIQWSIPWVTRSQGRKRICESKPGGRLHWHKHPGFFFALGKSQAEVKTAIDAAAAALLVVLGCLRSDSSIGDITWSERKRKYEKYMGLKVEKKGKGEQQCLKHK